ncbi:MAG: hypothetical protein HC906_08080 [Bacteroidales bacterium]|nr:hypothetical protein [Bacteroidales bacterium]
MKTKNLAIVILSLLTVSVYSQFEQDQLSGDDFEKIKVSVGGAFALQYQILDHEADSALIPMGSGFNLPTANFNLDADLAKGISLNLVTYLSSRHHNEAWVKGGYLLIDELPFIKSDAVDKLMDYLTLRVGEMELNYGDGHFRRSDNGNVIYNPFVGNYVMDAFTTAPALELMFRNNGLLAMGALTTGSVKQEFVTFRNNQYTAYDNHKELGFYWKLGYDKEFNEDFRGRLTISGFHLPEDNHNGTLYSGDRAGSRYYLVMNRVTNSTTDVDIKSNHLSGRFGPGTTRKNNSFMFNLFTNWKGFELFGTYELASGNTALGNEFDFNQFAAEALYRFGGENQFYLGGRYNVVNGDPNTAVEGDQSVRRYQIGAGWFLLKSTVLKIEYVDQDFTDFIPNYGAEAGFNGFMVEAGIAF